jgi:CheY-like chemotaxis protein/DNA-binding transcriptional ArsR family regulator
LRILVVDDDEDFREELAALLQDRGHAVTSVRSAREATSTLEGEEFDVMFTDIRVGRQSGLKLLAEARDKWPRLIVVMLTSNATVESAVHALQLGALDYVRKPVRPGQVERVLELVSQQLALTRVGAKALDPGQYATLLATEGGYEVLLIQPPPIRVSEPKVSPLPLDPDNPFLIRDAVDGFTASRDKAAVVLAAVEQLLARHREEQIAQLLGDLRAALEGKGPLVVGYDPSKISATGALAVQSSIVSADAQATLESLGNPIRRLVLRRLVESPCTFTQAQEAARIDDASKIAFHLRKLTESGLVAHLAGERYRLTSRGEGAIRILESIDELDSVKGSGNHIFPTKSTTDPVK